MTMACFLKNIQSFLENTPIGTERRRGDDRNSMACFLEKIKSFLENTPIGTERRRGDDRNDHGMFSRKDTIFFRRERVAVEVRFGIVMTAKMSTRPRPEGHFCKHELLSEVKHIILNMCYSEHGA